VARRRPLRRGLCLARGGLKKESGVESVTVYERDARLERARAAGGLPAAGTSEGRARRRRNEGRSCVKIRTPRLGCPTWPPRRGHRGSGDAIHAIEPATWFRGGQHRRSRTAALLYRGYRTRALLALNRSPPPGRFCFITGWPGRWAFIVGRGRHRRSCRFGRRRPHGHACSTRFSVLGDARAALRPRSAPALNHLGPPGKPTAG